MTTQPMEAEALDTPALTLVATRIDSLSPQQLVGRVEMSRAVLAEMCGFEPDYDAQRAEVTEYERRLGLYGWAVPTAYEISQRGR